VALGGGQGARPAAECCAESEFVPPSQFFFLKLFSQDALDVLGNRASAVYSECVGISCLGFHVVFNSFIHAKLVSPSE